VAMNNRIKMLSRQEIDNIFEKSMTIISEKGIKVDHERGLKELSPRHCTVCGSEDLSRLISCVAIIKSSKDHYSDLSWIDRDLAQRFKLT